MTAARALRAGGGYEVDAMADGDEPGVRALFRVPMEGAVSLSLEREPDLRLAHAIQGDRCRAVVVRERDTGRVVAGGTRTARRAHIGGDITHLGYLGELRRAPDAPPAALRLMREAFALLEAHRAPDELPFDLTSVMADNAPARRLLERGLPGMPRYQPFAELVTHVIECGGRGAPLRAAGAADIPAVVECLRRNLQAHPLAPVWTEDDLACPARCRGLRPDDFIVAGEGGRIRACAAVWDQRAFKQSVVRGYRGALGRARPAINALRALARKPQLPAPGAALPMAYLSHVAVDDREPGVFLDLLREARRRAKARGIDWLVTAFARGHPLGRAIERRVRPRSHPSVVYLVSSAGTRANVPGLYADIPHVEVATL